MDVSIRNIRHIYMKLKKEDNPKGDNMENEYEKAGVSLKAGYESVNRISKHVARTKTKEVISHLGQFGAMYDIGSLGYEHPVLISGCDGVGTKIKLCEEFSDYSNIGEDLVAMSVNDIIVQGAKPLYFLDYIACGKNEPQKIEEIVESIANGCILSNCSLVGGETAEMPGVYEVGGYDLAGFAVGCVEKEEIIDSSNVKPSNVIVGLKSNGIHSNGYSLVRKVLFENNQVDINSDYDILDCSLKSELLKPTKIYVKDVLKVLSEVKVNAMAHITGGGYQENILRATNGYGAKINTSQIEVLPIFKLISQLGNIPLDDMYNFFNMGIGYVFIVDESELERLKQILPEAIVIGQVVEKTGLELCK